MTNHSPRFSEKRKSNLNRQKSSYPVLSYFISKYSEIEEMRLQKLCFYADVIHMEELGEPITTVNWISVMDGAFSYDVREALASFEKMDGSETTVAYRRGRTTTGFVEPPNQIQIPSELAEFLTEVHNETKSVGTEELNKWSKNHPVYKTGGVDSPMDFSQIS